MESNFSNPGRAPVTRAGVDSRSRPGPSANAIAESAIFWLFLGALAWTPFWYGSNVLVAWGVNAVLFPGLAALYEVSILIRRDSHPIGIRKLAIPAALFLAVVLWIVFQNISWDHSPLAHPIWAMAADALERPVRGSISVNRDLTTLALLRLITAASVFWVAVQLCRNGTRANVLIISVAVIVCLYAAYGLMIFALNAGGVSWLEISAKNDFVTSTFINRNSFATFAGIGLVAICGMILQVYRDRLSTHGGQWRIRIASFIETTGQEGAALLGGAFVILVALLLTGSRGGIIATGFGLLILGVLTFAPGKRFRPVEAMIAGAVLVTVTLLAFGDVFIGSIAERGVSDAGRMAVYMITLRSIFDMPWLGYGYGTFADVFPMYRDRSIGVQGTWEQAHNTYLEVFQGLGLVFGTMLVACVLLLVLCCIRGAITRQRNVTVPRVAAAAAFLVGMHALVDFSLQIQAVALTFIAVLGAGVAQSESSRLALND